jgi:hypothetical protein
VEKLHIHGAPLWIIKFLLKFLPHQRQVKELVVSSSAFAFSKAAAAKSPRPIRLPPNELGGWVLHSHSTSILFSISITIWIYLKIKRRLNTAVFNKRRHSWVRVDQIIWDSSRGRKSFPHSLVNEGFLFCTTASWESVKHGHNFAAAASFVWGDGELLLLRVGQTDVPLKVDLPQIPKCGARVSFFFMCVRREKWRRRAKEDFMASAICARCYMNENVNCNYEVRAQSTAAEPFLCAVATLKLLFYAKRRKMHAHL